MVGARKVLITGRGLKLNGSSGVRVTPRRPVNTIPALANRGPYTRGRKDNCVRIRVK